MRIFNVICLTGGLLVMGCNQSPSPTTIEHTQETPAAVAAPSPALNTSPVNSESEHGHKPGAHGGIMVSLGRDSYHMEAVIERGGTLRLYTLGKDESRVIDIEKQTLKAYVKSEGDTDAESMTLEAAPQDGDAADRTSQFVGQLPERLVGVSLDVTIPNIVISGERFRAGFSTASHAEESMPDKLADDEERSLYLTPDGLYTAADIEANGNMTASQKFKGIKSSHDLFPKAGDKICPVTKTKANPQFTWVVGGKSYEFCCPPCVDEFVKMAKANSPEVLAPEEYVKP